LQQDLEQAAVENEATGRFLCSTLRDERSGSVLQKQRVDALCDVLAMKRSTKPNDHFDISLELWQAHLGRSPYLGIQLGVLRRRRILNEARNPLAEELLAL